MVFLPYCCPTGAEAAPATSSKIENSNRVGVTCGRWCRSLQGMGSEALQQDSPHDGGTPSRACSSHKPRATDGIQRRACSRYGAALRVRCCARGAFIMAGGGGCGDRTIHAHRQSGSAFISPPSSAAPFRRSLPHPRLPACLPSVLPLAPLMGS